MMRPARAWPMAILLLMGAAAAAEDVPHIQVAAEPAGGVRTLRLQEQWRIDVEDEEQLIGVVSGVLAGPGGTVWMGDQQLGQILEYSADGTFMRTYSRQGEGPGEINSPRSIMWLPGGALGIIDRKQGQITTLDSDGLPLTPIRLHDAGGEPMASAMLSSGRCRGGTLALWGTVFRFDDRPPTQTRFFSIFDPEGREVKSLMSAPSGFDFTARTYDEKADYFMGGSAWTIDAEGRFREIVRLAGEMDEDSDSLYRLADDRWIMLKNFKAARRAMFATYRAKAEATGETEDIQPLVIVCLRAVAE